MVLAIFFGLNSQAEETVKKEFVINVPDLLTKRGYDWEHYNDYFNLWNYRGEIVFVSGCSIKFEESPLEEGFFKSGDRFYLFLAGKEGGVIFERTIMNENSTISSKVVWLSSVAFFTKSIVRGVLFDEKENRFYLGNYGKNWTLPAVQMAFKDLGNSKFHIFKELVVSQLHKISEMQKCSIGKVSMQDYEKLLENLISDVMFEDGITVQLENSIDKP